MKVAVYYNNRDIRIEEIPRPEIGHGEILLKVMASGICGSDVMEWYRVKKAPLVLGHEVAGEIAEVGEGVKGWKVGDRVVVAHHVPCNTCRYCLNGHHSLCDTLRSTNFYPGGFSEYIRVPAINVDRGTFHLPEELSFEEGTFVEPLACVLRGLKVSRFRPSQRSLVIGSGVSGLLFVKTLRALGGGRIVVLDPKRYRLDKALESGADAALTPQEATRDRIRDMFKGWLPDLVVVCAGVSEAVEKAFHLVERGGTILFFAPLKPGTDVTMPFWDLWREGVTMTSTYAGAPSDMALALELLESSRIEVKDMITHRLGLEDTARGFEIVEKADRSIKVIIEPHH